MNKKKSEQDLDDIEFIISELMRFQRMEIRELMAYLREHKEDSFAFITGMDGNELTVGREAIIRFFELSTRHLATLKNQSRDFDEEKFTEKVIRQFVWTYLNKDNMKQCIETRDIDKMLSTAIKRAKLEHESTTHYIPCTLLHVRDAEAFEIGIVKFIPTEQFLKQEQEAFDLEKVKIRDEHISRSQGTSENADKSKTIANSAESFANKLVDANIEYIKSFNWLAIVTVPKCAKSISRLRAERAIECALNIIKLFIGRSHTENLRLGHTPGLPKQIAELTKNEEGVYDFSYGFNSEEMPANKNWIDILSQEDRFYIDQLIPILNLSVTSEDIPPLDQRIYDALVWYGQAISEKQISVQIVKYVAALERLTITKKMEEGLTQAVVKRVGTLVCDDYRNEEDFKKVLKNVGKVYDWRSNLMHGSVSPFEKKLETIAPLAEEITQKMIFRSIGFFARIKDVNANATTDDLESTYERLEVQVFGEKPKSDESI